MKSRLITGCLLAAFFVPVYSQTLKASWSPCDDCDGFRVYQYIDGEKIIKQEGLQTEYTQEIDKSVVIGVAAFNKYGESEVIPRLVVIEPRLPIKVNITVEVE